MVKKTASKGGFNIKSLPEGTYTVTVTKPGYKDQTLTLNITNGVLTVLDIKLDRI